MILGNGIDIIKNDRIKKLIEKYGEKFLKRVFTKNEIKYCQAKKNSSASFSARYAAKEAVLKALGTGMRNNNWQEIEIINNKLGKPEVKLFKKTKIQAKKAGIISIFISISHEKEYSIAQVIMEGAD